MAAKLLVAKLPPTPAERSSALVLPGPVIHVTRILVLTRVMEVIPKKEALLVGSVAVAVMYWLVSSGVPKVTVKPALQLASVVTFVEPRNVLPWPKPDESHARLAKNSIVKTVLL